MYCVERIVKLIGIFLCSLILSLNTTVIIPYGLAARNLDLESIPGNQDFQSIGTSLGNLGELHLSGKGKEFPGFISQLNRYQEPSRVALRYTNSRISRRSRDETTWQTRHSSSDGCRLSTSYSYKNLPQYYPGADTASNNYTLYKVDSSYSGSRRRCGKSFRHRIDINKGSPVQIGNLFMSSRQIAISTGSGQESFWMIFNVRDERDAVIAYRDSRGRFRLSERVNLSNYYSSTNYLPEFANSQVGDDFVRAIKNIPSDIGRDVEAFSGVLSALALGGAAAVAATAGFTPAIVTLPIMFIGIRTVSKVLQGQSPGSAFADSVVDTGKDLFSLGRIIKSGINDPRLREIADNVSAVTRPAELLNDIRNL